jgi:acetyltransferase-like isoleucine patch superfamily enzyme
MIHFMKRISLDGRLYIANNIVAYIPSHHLRSFFYRTVMRAQIGPGSHIFMRAWFDWPGGVSIGSNSIVNQRCRLDGRGGITIGSSVSISAEVCILTGSHDIQATDFRGFTSPVVIADYVFIGTRAMILPGVILGEGCVVAAGSIVTKDVAAYTIVAGVPAKQISDRNTQLRYSASYPRLFH